jgi:hypothetical protein
MSNQTLPPLTKIPPTAERPMSEAKATLVNALARIENEFCRREEFWRNKPSDGYDIANAMMVACAESKSVFRTVIEEIIK